MAAVEQYVMTGDLYAAAQRIFALEAENTRLRQAMRDVYHAGASEPGNRAAAVVEPLWKALQRSVE